MSDLLKSIDNAQIEAGKDKVVYKIDGWCVFQDRRPYSIQVRGDKTEIISCRQEKVIRKDVSEVLNDPSLSENAGFTLYVSDIDRIIKKYSEINVFVVSSQGEEEIFSADTQKIKKEYADTIFYNIDEIQMQKEKIVVRGWAVDPERGEQIWAEQEDHTKQPCEIRRSVRPDVNQMLHLTNQDYEAGFEITIDREKVRGKYLFLCIDNGYVKKSISVDLKKVEFENSRRGRLLKALEKEKFQQNKEYIQKHGWRAFARYLEAQMNPQYGDYNLWLKQHSASAYMLKRQRQHKFSYAPKIGVVIPLYNTPLNYLKEILESLLNQSYGNLEVCLADGSSEDSVEKFIRRKYGKNPRIRYQRLKKNMGISENTNAAIEMASGEYIMLSDHDDVVTRDALFEIVKALNKDRDADIVYTDEDKVTMDGKDYFDPNFKPDYNVDLLRSSNYICHIFVVKRSLLKEAGTFRKEYDGAQDFDLILRCCEKAKKIIHIPKILYHWRSHPNSTAGKPESKMYAFEAGRKALEAHYERLGIPASVELTSLFGRYRTVYQVTGHPKVSIIIPNKDHVEDLDKCLRSIWEKTSYDNYEIIIVENNSEEKDTFAYYEMIRNIKENVRILTWKKEFNYAAINNYAVSYAQGEFLLFLNNDVEIITERWIEEMLGYCQRDDVGIVGAKLYYPDDTVQHAGVIIGMGGVAGHIFCGSGRGEYGYCAKLVSAQDYSAVTAACMMTPKWLFQKVGGFDEGFQVAFNDIDYCMKVRREEKLVVFTPYAELYHYESKSRGKEETAAQLKRFAGEVHRFEEKWPEILKKGDPYYNPNLTLKKGDCSLRTMDE